MLINIFRNIMSECIVEMQTKWMHWNYNYHALELLDMLMKMFSAK